MNVRERLAHIQQNLKAPKGQYNSFGKYNYRSCEDILEGVKPLLGDAFLTLSDDVIEVNGWVYVKATASLEVNGEAVTTSALAREPELKKGMTSEQITGCASSYSRKYALNGLFCIDDTKDADTMDNREPAHPTAASDAGKVQKDFDALAKKLGGADAMAYARKVCEFVTKREGANPGNISPTEMQACNQAMVAKLAENSK